MSLDPELPLLGRALDVAAAEPCLQEVLAPRLGAIRLGAARLVRHKPGRRALIEYRIEVAGPGGSTVDQVLLGKLHHRGADRTSFTLHRALREAGLDGREPHGTGVAEPVALVPRLGLWLQRRVPGEALFPALWRPQEIARARRAADALARLHAVDVGSPRLHTLADELGMLGQRLQEAGRKLPRLAERIRRVLQACHELAAGMPSGEFRGVHRDFYFDQLLVSAGQVWLLDLDLYAQGDPALDVGNFVGHLMELGLREQGDPSALGGAIDVFREQYRSQVPSVPPPAVEGWTTLCLTRHIELSTRFEERRHTTEDLLRLVERRFGLTHRIRRRSAAHAV